MALDRTLSTTKGATRSASRRRLPFSQSLVAALQMKTEVQFELPLAALLAGADGSTAGDDVW